RQRGGSSAAEFHHGSRGPGNIAQFAAAVNQRALGYDDDVPSSRKGGPNIGKTGTTSAKIAGPRLYKHVGAACFDESWPGQARHKRVQPLRLEAIRIGKASARAADCEETD